jgi:hypothetical protein
MDRWIHEQTENEIQVPCSRELKGLQNIQCMKDLWRQTCRIQVYMECIDLDRSKTPQKPQDPPSCSVPGRSLEAQDMTGAINEDLFFNVQF